MDTQLTLAKEKVEAKVRIAELRAKTKHEQLRKEELELERELTQIKRPSILEWLKKLF